MAPKPRQWKPPKQGEVDRARRDPGLHTKRFTTSIRHISPTRETKAVTIVTS